MAILLPFSRLIKDFDVKKVLIPRKVYDEFREEIEQRKAKEEVKEETKTLYIYASEWPFFFLDPKDLQLYPFDKEHLIVFTKLLDPFYGTDVGGTVPGRVQDEPPALREIWMRRMAEVMGHELYIGI